VTECTVLTESQVKESFYMAYNLLYNLINSVKIDQNDVDRLLNLMHSTTLDIHGVNILTSYFNQLRSTDRITSMHSLKVAWYCVNLSKWNHMSFVDCRNSLILGMFHDIGKVGMPSAILNKPGKLTSDEFALIRQHPLFGSLWLKATGQISEYMIDIISSHHEKLNGCGYPSGRRNLNVETRILTLCDIFDALTSERTYKHSMSVNSAIGTMHSMMQSGELDVKIFKVFCDNVEANNDSDYIMGKSSDNSNIDSNETEYEKKMEAPKADVVSIKLANDLDSVNDIVIDGHHINSLILK
jgi:HD-GYP domain-containing protein (c-di-GMP phosphodiesterase class II)